MRLSKREANRITEINLENCEMLRSLLAHNAEVNRLTAENKTLKETINDANI